MQRGKQSVCGRRLALSLLLFLAATPAAAQGLVWSIPAEGQFIRYEGDFTQVIKRPNDPVGDLTLSWKRHLTIKSLQTEDAEFQGATVPCRWIEFKVITGPEKEGIIDAGPGGIGIYKVLVPVSVIEQMQVTSSGDVLDIDRVLATHLPIVKGYRKIGDESAAEIATNVFQVYPALTLIPPFRTLSNAGEEPVAVLNDSVTSTHWQGEVVTEDTFTRTTNSSEFWQTTAETVPFGLCKWVAHLVVEQKSSTQTRAEYVPLSEVTEEMTAAEVGTNAESELVID